MVFALKYTGEFIFCKAALSAVCCSFFPEAIPAVKVPFNSCLKKEEFALKECLKKFNLNILLILN